MSSKAPVTFDAAANDPDNKYRTAMLESRGFGVGVPPTAFRVGTKRQLMGAGSDCYMCTPREWQLGMAVTSIRSKLSVPGVRETTFTVIMEVHDSAAGIVNVRSQDDLGFDRAPRSRRNILG